MTEIAESLYQRALAIRARAQGEHHPETAETLYDFAAFQEAQGKDEEAISLYQRALAIRETALGAEHPRTAEVRERLSAVLAALKRTEETANAQRGRKPSTSFISSS